MLHYGFTLQYSILMSVFFSKFKWIMNKFQIPFNIINKCYDTELSYTDNDCNNPTFALVCVKTSSSQQIGQNTLKKYHRA